ncbi:MAG TPA: 30S ribosomal protein S9 [Candidatus Omnitrophota bacterium]|nr:30S ribosomal protein S9 [Candidatus Omnitrophota bacterium]
MKKAKKEKVASRFYGTGRRKSATARVWLHSGTGKIEVNRQPAEQYFCGRQHLIKIYHQPYVLTGTEGKYDVMAIVNGGGVPSQADALRMAIGRALSLADSSLRPTLRVKGMLTRDPREKERKKYGLKRARRAFQYTKR